MAQKKSAVEALALASILTELGEGVLELVRESGLLRTKRKVQRKTRGKRVAKRAASRGTKADVGAPDKSGLKVPPPRARAGTDGGSKGAVAEE